MSRRRHSIERASSRNASRWLGTMCCVRVNQNAERPVRTRPLSGISVGRTTSKVEMRSLATSSRRSSSSAYSSRTFPLATWVASGMHGLLCELAETIEDDADVLRVRRVVEDGVEVDAYLRVGADEIAEFEVFLPGAHRI